MRFFLRDVLFDEAGDGGAGGGGRLDPGAPVEIDDDPGTGGGGGKEKDPGADKDAEIARLKADNAKLSGERDQATNDARFWANKAGQTRQPVADEPDEDEPEPAPARGTQAANPKKLLDDMTEEGEDALKKRGFVTQDQLNAAIKQARKEGREEATSIAQHERGEAEFNGRLNSEFPELLQDAARVKRGEQPKSELYTETQRIYQELAEEDPSLVGSKSLLLLAARQAKKNIDGGGKGRKGSGPSGGDAGDGGNGNGRGRERSGQFSSGGGSDDDAGLSHRGSQQRNRRDRIDAQRGQRGNQDRGGEEGDVIQDAQTTTLLKGLGVSHEEYNKQRRR